LIFLGVPYNIESEIPVLIHRIKADFALTTVLTTLFKGGGAKCLEIGAPETGGISERERN
jgi:hypothetical protein